MLYLDTLVLTMQYIQRHYSYFMITDVAFYRIFISAVLFDKIGSFSLTKEYF